MRHIKKTAAVILSLMMIITMMPAMAFAEEDNTFETPATEIVIDEAAEEASVVEEPSEQASEITDAAPSVIPGEVYSEDADADESVYTYDEADCDPEYTAETEEGEAEFSFDEEYDASDSDVPAPEESLEDFFMSNEDPAKEESTRALSVKGDRLTGNNFKIYNNLKSIIKNVAAGKTGNAYKKMALSSYLGKQTITASQLGVKRIGYVKNGKWHVSSDVQKKLKKYVEAQNFSLVYACLLQDVANYSYWIDRTSSQTYYTWNCSFSYSAKKLTLKSTSYIKFTVPVSRQFRDGSINKADLNKIKAANKTKAKAKVIVETFDDAIPTTFEGYSSEMIDYYRLWFYCDYIDYLVDYDYDAYNKLKNKETITNEGPWAMINVFDGDPDTKVVCEGYARAYKYLCDLSTFKSNWIDCQVISGDAGEGHMWNIVRMNDGLNYVVDPTWTDDGSGANIENWFLKGDPYGTANSFTINGNTRTYDKQSKLAFAAAERTLAKKLQYEFISDAKISLKATKISKLTAAKKAFTVKWSKISTPLKALYIDGYQIQYSLKSNMKGAKTKTVKGYNKTSLKISKLKKKKYYYVRVRTFAKVGKKTYYSKWSAKKKIKTK